MKMNAFGVVSVSCRFMALAAACLLPVSNAWAQAQSWEQCRLLKESTERLNCYDHYADSLGGNKTLGSARSDIAPEKPVAQSADEALFGQESISTKAPQNRSPEKIDTVLENAGRELSKGNSLQLSNGQVWTYIDERRLYVSTEKPSIEIKRNFVGNYFMSVKGVSGTYRVVRTQ